MQTYQVKAVSSSIEAVQFTSEMAQTYIAWHLADPKARSKPPELPPHTTYSEGGGFVLETVEGGVRLVYGDYVTDVNGRAERIAEVDFDARWETGQSSAVWPSTFDKDGRLVATGPAKPGSNRVDLGTEDLRLDKDGRLTDDGKLEALTKHMAPAKTDPKTDTSWPSAEHAEKERTALALEKNAAAAQHTQRHAPYTTEPDAKFSADMAKAQDELGESDRKAYPAKDEPAHQDKDLAGNRTAKPHKGKP